MSNFNLRKIIESKLENYFSKYPAFITNAALSILNNILRVDEFSAFLEKNSDKRGIELIDAFFEYLDFTYMLSNKDNMKIPSEGKLICVANHPLGGLDALSILKAVSEVRSDVKVVANDVLLNFEQISDLFIPYDVFSLKAQKATIRRIQDALADDQAILFFPSGEVSRLTFNGIREKHWQNGAVRFAHKHNVPVLPIFVKSRNTMKFYATSLLNKKMSMFLLSDEIFKKRHKFILLKIGDPIPAAAFRSKYINFSVETQLLKKHVYKIGKERSGIFRTENTIIHPVGRKILKNELSNCKLLYSSPDNKKVFLADYHDAENVVKEISRLRELTFRKVGEGTGLKNDFDDFDKYYKHLVLWDEDNLEIAGSYRISNCRDILLEKDSEGLYNSGQFLFSRSFRPVLMQSMELGRSFIQEEYWKTNALDLIWKGIGSLLQNQFNNVRYLYGAVSISDSYPEKAKNLIVYYYRKWYMSDKNYALAKNKFTISGRQEAEISFILNGEDHQEDFRILKSTLKNYGLQVPVLLRNYMNLVEYGGGKVLDFGIDTAFSNSIDVLILIDLLFLKEAIRNRYYPQKEILEKISQN